MPLRQHPRLYFPHEHVHELRQVIIDLPHLKNALLVQGLSDFARYIITFCVNWLEGLPQLTVSTSGSTGPAKQISVSRQAARESARLTRSFFNLNDFSHLLLCINPRYIGGKMMIIRALEGNDDLTAVPPEANPLRGISLHRPLHFCAMVPYQLTEILENAPEDVEVLNHCSGLIIGGAPVSGALERLVEALRFPVYSTFGMTETVSHVALRRLNSESKSPFFTCLPETECWTDERGCLCFRGPMTENKTVVTNDLGEIPAKGKFRWLGRRDLVINSGGVKIPVEQIEGESRCLLEKFGYSGSVCLIGIRDVKLGQKAVLYVEGVAPATEITEQIHSLLKKDLPQYYSPKALIFKEKLPRLPSGKIDRMLLTRLHRDL